MAWYLDICNSCVQSIEKRPMKFAEDEMATNEIIICGLPSWIGIQRNDTATFINNILLASVNGPSAIFAFLGNLAVIITIIKTPSLQKPCNILLCSLAFADCLTGVTCQPMFVVWRLFLQRVQQSCLHQVLVLDVYYFFYFYTVGLSFVNIVFISFDRHFALSRPLVYIAEVSKSGEMIKLR